MNRRIPALLLLLAWCTSGCDHRLPVTQSGADGAATAPDAPDRGATTTAEPPTGQGLAAFCSGGAPRVLVEGEAVPVSKVIHRWGDVPRLAFVGASRCFEVDLDGFGEQIPPVPSLFNLQKMSHWDKEVYVLPRAADRCGDWTDFLSTKGGDAVSGWVRFSPTTASYTFAVATACVVARRGDGHSPPPAILDAGIAGLPLPRWIALYAPGVPLSYP